MCFFFFIPFIYLLEVKGNLLVGELSIDGSESLGPSFYVCLVLGVKVNLHNSLSISLDPSSLSNNLGGVDNVLKNSILHSRQCSRARTRSTGLLVSVVGLS